MAAMFGRKGRRRGRPRVAEAVDPFVLFGLVGRVEAGGAVLTEPVPSGLRRHSSRNDQHSRGRRAAIATRSSREEAFGGTDVVRGRRGSGSCWSCCSRLYRRDGSVCAFRYIQRERAGLVYSHTRRRAAWRERRLRRVQMQRFRMNRSINQSIVERTTNTTTTDDPPKANVPRCSCVYFTVSTPSHETHQQQERWVKPPYRNVPTRSLESPGSVPGRR